MLEIDEAVHLGRAHASHTWHNELLHLDLPQCVHQHKLLNILGHRLQNVETHQRLNLLDHINDITWKSYREQEHVNDDLQGEQSGDQLLNRIRKEKRNHQSVDSCHNHGERHLLRAFVIVLACLGVWHLPCYDLLGCEILNCFLFLANRL